MTKKSDLRKAAVLISSLDETAGQALLAEFPPAMAAAVRRTAENLHDVSHEERRRVMSEFLSATGDQESKQSGVELDDSLARKLVDGYEDPPPWSPPENQTPFRFLHEAPVKQLVRLLSSERPQMIALVLAHLPAQKAATALGRFDKSLQADVLTRLAELDDASPQVLKEIETELQDLLAQKHRVSQKRAAGFATVSAILGAAGNADRRSLLASLAVRDSKLLARLGYPARDDSLAELDSTGDERDTGFAVSRENELPPIGFSDLVELDDASLATIVARADRQLLQLALSGAEESLIARMTAGLTRGEARSLRRQLVAISPVRLSDMEAAQGQMAALADRLCRSKVIVHPFASTTLLAG